MRGVRGVRGERGDCDDINANMNEQTSMWRMLNWILALASG